MSVDVYVEGGGDQSEVQRRCRRGFSELFRKIVPSRSPRIIVCGGRRQAYDDFVTALATRADRTSILLVDAEAPLTQPSAWVHVAKRPGDRWPKPTGVSDHHLHLMVQTMESWIVVDRAVLADYYGHGFKASALPKAVDIETVAKADVAKKLDLATKGTKTKGKYHKTQHGFDLLASLDPDLLRSASAHAERLFAWLAANC